MCEIVYNILITNFTVHRCIIRSNAPSNLQMQPLGCIFVYALNCITFGTAIDPACGSGGMFVQSSYRHIVAIETISRYMVRKQMQIPGKWQKWTWQFVVLKQILDHIKRIHLAMICIKPWRRISFWQILHSTIIRGDRNAWQKMFAGNMAYHLQIMRTMPGFSIWFITLHRTEKSGLYLQMVHWVRSQAVKVKSESELLKMI